MNNSPLPVDRKPNESDLVWRSRVRSYISKNAPKEHRYFIRDGKPGGKGQRWILPGAFIAIGIFFAYGGYAAGADVRDLNGPNSQQGEFIVENVQQRYGDTKNQEDPYTVPVVVIRGESIVPLYTKGRDFSIGDSISLRYTGQGQVAAAFAGEDGRVSHSAPLFLGIAATIFIAIGLLVGKFYRGAVDSKYIDDEYAKLTKDI